jgi:hypothetical protein
MGVVINFPADSAASRVRGAGTAARCCEVVILPVIRIDRYEDKPVLRPARGGMPGGKRRRRATRS